jgi:glycerol-3-phosphate responsive antiterminator
VLIVTILPAAGCVGVVWAKAETVKSAAKNKLTAIERNVFMIFYNTP